MVSFYLNYIFKCPIPKYQYIHIQRYWGLRPQHMNHGAGGGRHSSAYNRWVLGLCGTLY